MRSSAAKSFDPDRGEQALKTTRRYWPIILLLLAGCGNKGDLYLPEAPAEPAPVEDEEEDG